ncbi:MAG TPA: hypothetical protein VJQ57_01380, partial [Acidimicrobiia bacterium]|nr:hypothetical protein [Acidimicrobiia bacterium]
QTGLSPAECLSLSPDYSLGKLHGMLEKRRRVSGEDSRTQYSDRYLVIQASFDQSAHKIWGLAVGPDGEIIANALHKRETELPILEDQTSGQRRIDALASICLDSITGTGEEGGEGRAVTVAEVFIDALLATETEGEVGVTLASGPKLGPDFLVRDPLWGEGAGDLLRAQLPLLLRSGGGGPSRPPGPGDGEGHGDVCDRWLSEPLPLTDPPHPSSLPGWGSSPRQPDHPLLVSPPCRHPRDGDGDRSPIPRTSEKAETAGGPDPPPVVSRT